MTRATLALLAAAAAIALLARRNHIPGSDGVRTTAPPGTEEPDWLAEFRDSGVRRIAYRDAWSVPDPVAFRIITGGTQ